MSKDIKDVILRAENICKSYVQSSHTLHVLKKVDVQIKKGEIVTIVGPSGAGKSTLLHILGGLDQPNEGKVFIEGEDLYDLDDSDRARIRNKKIGFVFQFYHLLPEFTALENTVLPVLVREKNNNFRQYESLGMEMLSRVGLKERAKHKPNQLSGGEQQRVAIARSLINQPAIIFCDEPTGNLDSETGKDIIKLLIKLNRDNTQTLVIVTHDENIAKESHRTVYMKDGQLIQ